MIGTVSAVPFPARERSNSNHENLQAGNLARACAFLAFAAIAGWCAAVPAVQWSAAGSGTKRLEPDAGPNSHWRVEAFPAHRSRGSIQRGITTRERLSWYTLTVPSTARPWLRVQYLDRGYGLIAVSYGADGVRGVPQPKQWGVAR